MAWLFTLCSSVSSGSSLSQAVVVQRTSSHALLGLLQTCQYRINFSCGLIGCCNIRTNKFLLLFITSICQDLSGLFIVVYYFNLSGLEWIDCLFITLCSSLSSGSSLSLAMVVQRTATSVSDKYTSLCLTYLQNSQIALITFDSSESSKSRASRFLNFLFLTQKMSVSRIFSFNPISTTELTLSITTATLKRDSQCENRDQGFFLQEIPLCC